MKKVFRTTYYSTQVLLVCFVFDLVFSLTSNSQNCAPNNPKGLNSSTICFTFVNTIQNHPHLRTGHAFKGFTGRPVSPFEPGKSLIDTPIDSDYFTEIHTNDSKSVTIRSNKGKTWTIKN